jgi:hypothetical protein
MRDARFSRYDMPPRYFHDGTMTPEEQFEWVTQQEHRDPYWAHTEADIRRMAVEIQNRLNIRGDTEIVTTSVPTPAAGPMGVSYRTVRFMITRLGAVEELLLIEEQLRRAMRARD